MSSKIGVLLSMIFVAIFFLFGVDMVTLQFQYSDLDSKGVTIGYHISKAEKVEDTFISFLEGKYNVRISLDKSQSMRFGDVVEFIVVKEFDPIIISNHTMDLKIKRSTVIGYYGI